MRAHNTEAHEPCGLSRLENSQWLVSAGRLDGRCVQCMGFLRMELVSDVLHRLSLTLHCVCQGGLRMPTAEEGTVAQRKQMGQTSVNQTPLDVIWLESC